MKKLIALVLALAMVLAVAVASAATITITQDATSGTLGAESYNLYKIFDVTKTSSVTEDVTTDSTLGSTTASGFSYTIASNSPWVAKLGSFSGDTWTSATNQSYVTLAKIPGDTTKYNVVASGLSSAANARAFAAFLLDNKGNITADETMTSDTTTGVATKTDVDDGYWLIDSTLGTNLVLATSNITINTKNDYPTDNKQVDKEDHRIGDMVLFTITVDLPASIDYGKDVTVHDTMSDVLTLNSNAYSSSNTYGWRAYVKEYGADGDGDDFSSYVTLSTGKANAHNSSTHAVGDHQVGYDFVLNIDTLEPSSGSPTKKTVTIKYYAELTADADADTEYFNREFTEYSQYKTSPKTVIVKTFDFELDKSFSGIATADQVNYWAEFELYESNGTTAINLKQDTEFEEYHVPDSSETATTNKFKVKGGNTGVIVKGLEAGTYKIKETATSAGFNTMGDVITVVISTAGAVTYTIGSGSSTTGNITVVNQSGTVLPSTGGIGTTIFYVLGGLLVVGAAVILVARRKAHD